MNFAKCNFLQSLNSLHHGVRRPSCCRCGGATGHGCSARRFAPKRLGERDCGGYVDADQRRVRLSRVRGGVHFPGNFSWGGAYFRMCVPVRSWECLRLNAPVHQPSCYAAWQCFSGYQVCPNGYGATFSPTSYPGNVALTMNGAVSEAHIGQVLVAVCLPTTGDKGLQELVPRRQRRVSFLASRHSLIIAGRGLLTAVLTTPSFC